MLTSSNEEKKTKSIWVHPINERRNEAGTFYTLFDQFSQDDATFFNYFKMSIKSFDELHRRIKDSIHAKILKSGVAFSL
nr:unnamed protein product [Callosobruchus chinensis]